jgi:hypothetical protein
MSLLKTRSKCGLSVFFVQITLGKSGPKNWASFVFLEQCCLKKTITQSEKSLKIWSPGEQKICLIYQFIIWVGAQTGLTVSFSKCNLKIFKRFLQFVCIQGDQIGRIFAYWVTVYFG